MRFGVCMPIEQAEFIAKLGFDYLEVSAAGLAEMTEAQFADFLQKNEAAPIHAEAANCMFPGSIKLTGDNVDFEAIQTYVHHAIGRLAQAGIKIGVFGSGGSRRVPENFPREKAWEQLKTVAKILGDAGEKYGVTIALESLRHEETNIFTMQPEALKFVKEVNHPHFKLLCDYYHLISENGTPEMVERCGDILVRTHIANPVGRVPMTPQDTADYKAFFHALHFIGYNARMSLECPVKNPETQLPVVLEVLHRCDNE